MPQTTVNPEQEQAQEPEEQKSSLRDKMPKMPEVNASDLAYRGVKWFAKGFLRAVGTTARAIQDAGNELRNENQDK